jgi:hypothetical protein
VQYHGPATYLRRAKRLLAFGDDGGERGVGRVVISGGGEVLFAGLILTNEDTEEGTVLEAVVVTDGSPQHGIARLVLINPTHPAPSAA